MTYYYSYSHYYYYYIYYYIIIIIIPSFAILSKRFDTKYNQFLYFGENCKGRHS